MNVLYVDLEREWRGGQSQALLTLRGLRERGHEVELLAARDSAVANRAAEAGVKVHQVPRFGLRGWTAVEMRKLTARKRFELVHLNEPHALTAAWLARAHARVPLLLSRRIGFPLQRNAVSQARYRAVERFLANSKDVAQSLVDSGIAAERISIVNEGVEISPLRTLEQRGSARKRWAAARRRRRLPRRTGGSYKTAWADRSGAFPGIRKGSCSSVRGSRRVSVPVGV